LAGELKAKQQLSAAIHEYTRACEIDPTWSEPFYNLGLLYKYEGEWALSLEANLRATQLAPNDEAGWWNLGIAATALERWDMARFAWRGAGVKVTDGAGPVDCPCGHAPIRLDPDGNAEVVWSERLDPARARLLNIPMADYCFGDIVLNDGAPVGYRQRGGRQVPVFNCLELLVASPFSTWSVLIDLPEGDSAEPTIGRLEGLALERDLAAEDWTRSVRILCKQCSEGTPHAHHDNEPSVAEQGPHRVAVAARTEAEVRDLLGTWQPDAPQARVTSVELLLSRDS